MKNSPESEARRALARLRRAMEKAQRELADVHGALRHAEADDFPAADFAAAETHLQGVIQFVTEQAERLEEKMLHAGGLEPGRVRRTGST
jgi:hypothetical protein